MTWREVELRREYLRGWIDALRNHASYSEGGAATELASLEALKPCPNCEGGKVRRECVACSDSGIQWGTP